MTEDAKDQSGAVATTTPTVEAQEAALAAQEEKLLVPELYFEKLPKRMQTKFATHQADMAMARMTWKQRAIEKQAVQQEACDIANSGVFGQRTWQQVMAIGLCGKDLNLSLSQSMMSIHIVKERPTLEAQLMRALVQRSGKGHVEITWDDPPTKCTAIGHRAGQPDLTFSFGAKEAKAAGYDSKPTYKAHPLQMYMARASSVVCRGLFPDIIGGMHSIEEMGYTREELIENPQPIGPAPLEDGVGGFGDAKDAEVEAPTPPPETAGGSDSNVEPETAPQAPSGEEEPETAVEAATEAAPEPEPAPEPAPEPEPEKQPEPEVDPKVEAEIDDIMADYADDDPPLTRESAAKKQVFRQKARDDRAARETVKKAKKTDTPTGLVDPEKFEL